MAAQPLLLSPLLTTLHDPGSIEGPHRYPTGGLSPRRDVRRLGQTGGTGLYWQLECLTSPRRCGKSTTSLLPCILSSHLGNSNRVGPSGFLHLALHILGFTSGNLGDLHTVRFGTVFTFCGFTPDDDMTHSYRASSPRTLTHRTPVQRSYSRYNRLRISADQHILRIFASFRHPVIVRSPYS